MERESFRSRLGFLLVSAGCAIGIGNVWRFPYIAGKNGGGYFVLFYLICLLVMGVPVLTMELAVGRASRKSAILSYKKLEKPGQKWHTTKPNSTTISVQIAISPGEDKSVPNTPLTASAVMPSVNAPVRKRPK